MESAGKQYQDPSTPADGSSLGSQNARDQSISQTIDVTSLSQLATRKNRQVELSCENDRYSASNKGTVLSDAEENYAGPVDKKSKRMPQLKVNAGKQQSILGQSSSQRSGKGRRLAKKKLVQKSLPSQQREYPMQTPRSNTENSGTEISAIFPDAASPSAVRELDSDRSTSPPRKWVERKDMAITVEADLFNTDIASTEIQLNPAWRKEASEVNEPAEEYGNSEQKRKFQLKPGVTQLQSPKNHSSQGNLNPHINLPPPEEIYQRSRSAAIREDCVYYGLNMMFGKCPEYSLDADQAGGDLGQNQATHPLTWGVNGCPPSKQIWLQDYVSGNLKSVIFCRYGSEYLKSFPRNDDVAVGSYKINVENLILQKLKHQEQDGASIMAMNFLKTKGQLNAQKQAKLQQQHMIYPYHRPAQEETLTFDSVFESGNLAIALKASETEYNLILQNDVNTNGHTQWYYFKVRTNFTHTTRIKFNLVNMYKPKSLYQQGLRVLVLDPKNGEKDSEGLPKWSRGGEDIVYQQNRFTNEQCPNGLFELSFCYEFPEGAHEYYFAHSLPFTYSMLCKYLNANVTREKAKRGTLCHSLAGNKVEYLMITGKRREPLQTKVFKEDQAASNGPSGSPRRSEIKSTSQLKARSPTKKVRDKQDKQDKTRKELKPIEKQIIVLTSRVHPGETNASWMMHGLLELLLNPAPEDEELLTLLKDHFEFYIVPMLNVDGVITGNYRCSLAACDLNRKYHKPSKVLHAPVYYMKKLCATLSEQENRSFYLYLDFHGHSAKMNIFNFGNTRPENGFAKRGVHHPPSMFPLVLSKNPDFDYFSFNDCTFNMPPAKASTARMTMFHKLRIPFVFTLEASFAGASRGRLAGKHFSAGDQMAVGRYVLRAIWDVKKLEYDRRMLKLLVDEAQALRRAEQENNDEASSASSDDDVAIVPKAKKKIPGVAAGSEAADVKSPEPGTAEGSNMSPCGSQVSVTKQSDLGGASVAVPSPKSLSRGQTAHLTEQKTKSPKRKIINLKQLEPFHTSTKKKTREEMRDQRRWTVAPDAYKTAQLEKLVEAERHDTEISSQASKKFSGEQSAPLVKEGTERTRFGSQMSPTAPVTSAIKQNKQHRHMKNRRGKPDALAGNQQLFEQLNHEIERSQQAQQHALDEIFKQAASKFLRPETVEVLQTNQDWGINTNANGTKARLLELAKAEGLTMHQARSRSSKFEALMQLQKLHQMQKLNQIAQTQFFKQQAELLLSQNLTPQLQLELFQQFSFYQAELQVQNSKFQLNLQRQFQASNPGRSVERAPQAKPNQPTNSVSATQKRSTTQKATRQSKEAVDASYNSSSNDLVNQIFQQKKLMRTQLSQQGKFLSTAQPVGEMSPTDNSLQKVFIAPSDQLIGSHLKNADGPQPLQAPRRQSRQQEELKEQMPGPSQQRQNTQELLSRAARVIQRDRQQEKHLSTDEMASPQLSYAEPTADHNNYMMSPTKVLRVRPDAVVFNNRSRAGNTAVQAPIEQVGRQTNYHGYTSQKGRRDYAYTGRKQNANIFDEKQVVESTRAVIDEESKKFFTQREKTRQPSNMHTQNHPGSFSKPAVEMAYPGAKNLNNFFSPQMPTPAAMGGLAEKRAAHMFASPQNADRQAATAQLGTRHAPQSQHVGSNLAEIIGGNIMPVQTTVDQPVTRGFRPKPSQKVRNDQIKQLQQIRQRPENIQQYKSLPAQAPQRTVNVMQQPFGPPDAQAIQRIENGKTNSVGQSPSRGTQAARHQVMRNAFM